MIPRKLKDLYVSVGIPLAASSPGSSYSYWDDPPEGGRGGRLHTGLFLVFHVHVFGVDDSFIFLLAAGAVRAGLRVCARARRWA